MRWLWNFGKRFLLFCVVVIGAARTFSWFFGFDDDMKAWAPQHRTLLIIVLLLSAIMYAMYDWMLEDRGG